MTILDRPGDCMSRTPLSNRALSDDGRKTPLGNRVLPAKDKTPLSTRIVKTPQANQVLPAVDADQQLLDVLRSLNLAVAVVAVARERCYTHPGTKLSPRVVSDALLHLKDAVQLLDQMRRSGG
jgi:hypothetical protein